MASSVDGIAGTILGEAAQTGGNIWNKTRNGSQVYIKGYAQSLVDIAGAVAAGDMSEEEGKAAAQSASFFFQMMVANASQVTLFEVQTFLNKVIGAVKDTVNAA